jgi:hypothetical protein
MKKTLIVVGLAALAITAGACGSTTSTPKAPKTAAPVVAVAPAITVPTTTQPPVPTAVCGALVTFNNDLASYVNSNGTTGLTAVDNEATTFAQDALAYGPPFIAEGKTLAIGLENYSTDGLGPITKDLLAIKATCNSLGSPVTGGGLATTTTTPAPAGPSAAVVTFCATLDQWDKAWLTLNQTGNEPANFETLSEDVGTESVEAGPPFEAETATLAQDLSTENIAAVDSAATTVTNACTAAES